MNKTYPERRMPEELELSFGEFWIDLNHLLRFLVYREIELPKISESFWNLSEEEQEATETAGFHLHVGFPLMEEAPELESGVEQLMLALKSRQRKIRGFISGELDIALEYELIDKAAFERFQNTCQELEIED